MRETELDSWRPAPTQPYRLPAAQLHLPRRALQRALEVCRQSGRLETCCLFYGKRDIDRAFIEAVVVPAQQQTWGNYFVPIESMRTVHARVAPLGLRNLAQLHSHPGHHVEHSSYDDEMANSRKALSLVVPHYGHWQNSWPSGIGVHEFQNDFWHLLCDGDAMRRIVLTDTPAVNFVDCR